MIRRSLSFIAREETRAYWTGLAIAFYLVMLVWSAVPGQHEQLAGNTHDKVLHFGAYGFIAFALYLGQPKVPKRAIRVVTLIALLGGIDESLQWLEPHRTPDITDWAVDVLAAVAVAMTMRLGRRPLLAVSARRR